MTSGATFSNPIVVDDSDDETASTNDNVTVDYNDRPVVPASMIDQKTSRPATAPSLPTLAFNSILGASLAALGITRIKEKAGDGKRSSSEPKALPSRSTGSASTATSAAARSESPLYGYEQDGDGYESTKSDDGQATVRQNCLSPARAPLVARARSDTREAVNSSPNAADGVDDEDDDATQPLPLTLSMICNRCGETLSDCKCPVDIQSPPIPPSPASSTGGDLVNEFQTDTLSKCHKCGESLEGAQHPYCDD